MVSLSHAPSQPTPSTHALDSARRITQHFDGFAPEYHAAAFDGAGMQHLSDLDLAAVDAAANAARPGGRAVDVGVGTGRIAGRVMGHGFTLVGVDDSPGMLAQAARRLPQATLRRGSLAAELPVADGEADLVTCLRVVKYLPEWPRAVRELARVAAPDGVVCFDLANRRSAARFGYPDGMVWGATWPEASAAISAAGLRVMEARPGVHLPDPVWRWASSTRRAAVVVGLEATPGRLLGRRFARSWTFLCRRVEDSPVGNHPQKVNSGMVVPINKATRPQRGSAMSAPTNRLRTIRTILTGLAVVAIGMLAFARTAAAEVDYDTSDGITISDTDGQLQAGGAVEVTGTGFKAGSEVKGYLHSDPILLGTLTADSAGVVSGAFTIPADAPAGSHTITLEGVDPSDSPRVLSLAVEVVAADAADAADVDGTPDALSFTGSTVAPLAAAGALLVVAGVVVVRFNRRRAGAAA